MRLISSIILFPNYIDVGFLYYDGIYSIIKIVIVFHIHT